MFLGSPLILFSKIEFSIRSQPYSIEVCCTQQRVSECKKKCFAMLVYVCMYDMEKNLY